MLVQKFGAHIENQLSFLRKKKLLIACSGGLDSTALVHLFQSLDITFAIAHCNFKLRGLESDGDETFVSEMADTVDAPFFVTHFETEQYAKTHKISIQMAARALRYDWFENLVSS